MAYQVRKKRPLFLIQYAIFSYGKLIDITHEDDIVNAGKVKASPLADMKVLSLMQDLMYAPLNDIPFQVENILD